MRKGFTLVELLIVITVIVILAAITVVAYGSLQNHGYETAVQSDLDSAAGLIESFRVSTSSSHAFPQSTTDLSAVGLKATKASYDVSVAANFVYCVNTTDYQSYYLAALSKDDAVYLMTQDGFTSTTLTASSFGNATSLCSSFGANFSLVSNGMSSANTWQSWINS
jgi:prepilin-type N-terminal cleavage/methylation domain-containing protein